MAVACPDIMVDLRHRQGRTALHRVVWAGRIGLVQVLFSRASDARFSSGFKFIDDSACAQSFDNVFHEKMRTKLVYEGKSQFGKYLK